MQVIFKVIRQTKNAAPRVQNYILDVLPQNTILECLNQIKWEQDGSLAFRKNCRNTICGACGMKINGRSALACKENVGSELAKSEKPEILIEPLDNMPVIKDLVVDMKSFWNRLEAIAPYVSHPSPMPAQEFLQTPQERETLDAAGNCILCGVCYAECNGREVNANFVGPHALAKAQRLLSDSRDERTEERLNHYDDKNTGVWGCNRCYLCNAVCPTSVSPLDQISLIKRQILAREDD